ncbi:MAG: trimethylamine methyltransferase family protein [Deltaproteobacteria bacterium]|nr:trimethylamine methyltransferase family protein [Deltaproteobacteria bacterium]
MSLITPQITVLKPDQIARIHAYSLEILSTVGIRIDSKEARGLFVKAQCPVMDDNRVLIPPELIQWAIAAAPGCIDIYDRNEQFAFQLGNAVRNQTRFGVGCTNLYYQDPITDKVESFSRNHMMLSVRLGDRLDGFDVVTTPGIIQELPAAHADLYASLEMIANTVKPLVVLVSEPGCLENVLNLFEHLQGDLSRNPFIIPYFNPITPLVLNAETTGKIAVTVRRGLPFIYNNYGMSGATAPITPAGTLAVLNAELLAGLVYAQLLKEGTPVILGSLPAGFDMKTMMSLYTPHTMLLNLASAEMMAHYDLPHSGTSGSATGWGPDLLASGTFWMNHLTGCLGKVGLAPSVGGNFDSLAFSPATVIYANQVIRQARLFSAGFRVDDEAVAMEEIASIGPAGNYLMADSTCKLFRKFDYSNEIWPGLTIEQWQAEGEPRADDLIRKYTRQLLADLSAPKDYEELTAKGEAFIALATGG